MEGTPGRTGINGFLNSLLVVAAALISGNLLGDQDRAGGGIVGSVTDRESCAWASGKNSPKRAMNRARVGPRKSFP